MAITSADQITVVLSGGTVNLDPANSLGGEPSGAPISSGVLNNLFDDVSPEQSESGHEDYRCIYFFNDGETTVYQLQIYILSDYAGGATIELGVAEANETQRIQISGAEVTGGVMTLSYEGVEFDSTYDSDLGNWATTLEDTLNALNNGGDTLLEDVTVNAGVSGSDTIVFDILFTGNDSKKNHEPITYVSDTFTPAVTVTIQTIQQGSPINTIAPDIGIETTPPGGVSFYAPDATSPITLPLLRPEDGFPLWVKRVTIADTAAVEDDGFSLRFYAESLG